ncbi:hypothetical protein MTR67_001453 [Solanum verrucosum]|uniref:Tf2-1-like SH3-like domain-containing protein n=1 Tax=Solanum verrucosum TaxID=315347 RepID=A0AAF0PN81_SOLVR|nr:hypothetical protein MTR67_001453 [Solanum verrucosum]
MNDQESDLGPNIRSGTQPRHPKLDTTPMIDLRSILDTDPGPNLAFRPGPNVKSKQGLDPNLVELKETMLKKSIEAFSQRGDDVLRYQGRVRCISPIGWFEIGEVALIGPELVHKTMEKVRLIRKRRIGKVAYELDFSNDLALVHPVFHISLLKKCVGDPINIVPLENLGVKENLSYEEISVEILDRQVKKLINEEVASIKVL